MTSPTSTDLADPDARGTWNGLRLRMFGISVSLVALGAGIGMGLFASAGQMNVANIALLILEPPFIWWQLRLLREDVIMWKDRANG